MPTVTIFRLLESQGQGKPPVIRLFEGSWDFGVDPYLGMKVTVPAQDHSERLVFEISDIWVELGRSRVVALCTLRRAGVQPPPGVTMGLEWLTAATPPDFEPVIPADAVKAWGDVLEVLGFRPRES